MKTIKKGGTYTLNSECLKLYITEAKYSRQVVSLIKKR